MKKVVVHHQGGGLFRMVELCRLFKSSEEPGGESYVLGIPVRQRPWVMERIHDLVSAADLVQQLDEFADQWITQRIDAFDLPMKARKALQDNGFPVNDVEIYPASQGR